MSRVIMLLSQLDFKQVIKNTPLISLDLIVTNEDRQLLLGLRKNRPAQGYWFVPGGRILKDETIESAFERLTLNELGKTFFMQQGKFKGVYQHFYADSAMSEGISTHYVVLAYQLSVNLVELNLPTEQHSCYQWLTADEALSEQKVHLHSKWYFE